MWILAASHIDKWISSQARQKQMHCFSVYHLWKKDCQAQIQKKTNFTDLPCLSTRQHSNYPASRRLLPKAAAYFVCAYWQLLIWSVFSGCFLSWALWFNPGIPQTWAGFSVEISEKPEEVRCPNSNRKCCLASHAPLETATYSFSCFGDAVIFLKVAS